MPRANSSVPKHRRHRKVVKQAKGYYGARSRNFKTAKDAVEKAGLYAIEIVDKRNVSFVVYGLFELMQLRGNMACPTHSLFLDLKQKV